MRGSRFFLLFFLFLLFPEVDEEEATPIHCHQASLSATVRGRSRRILSSSARILFLSFPSSSSHSSAGEPS